jgi:CAAX protease family protein
VFERLSDRTASILFIVLTLAISLGTANIAGGIILAFSPLLVALAMLLVVTKEGYSRNGWGRLGMGRLGLRIWPLTVAVTAGVSVFAAAGTVAFGFARFTAPHGDWAQSALMLCVTGPILAFAEEIGWRGYLQPRLAFLGERRAMFVIGVVWIAWHLPYILLTPYYHSDGERALVLPLFGASVIAFSFLIGYLRTISDSVWPAVLAHFAHNATFAWMMKYATSTKHPVIVGEYLAGDTGLLVFIGTAACALVIGIRYSAASRRPAHASGRG